MATDAKNAKIVFGMWKFKISVNIWECAFPCDYFEAGSRGEQSLTRDDLNLYLFHMQKETPNCENHNN